MIGMYVCLGGIGLMLFAVAINLIAGTPLNQPWKGFTVYLGLLGFAGAFIGLILFFFSLLLGA